MTTVKDAKFDIKLSMFNGSVEEDFQLWKLRVKVTLRGRDSIDELTNESFDKTITQKTLSIIISALGQNPLRAIQECETIYSVWQELHHRYAGKSVINKLNALNNLMN